MSCSHSSDLHVGSIFNIKLHTWDTFMLPAGHFAFKCAKIASAFAADGGARAAGAATLPLPILLLTRLLSFSESTGCCCVLS